MQLALRFQQKTSKLRAISRMESVVLPFFDQNESPTFYVFNIGEEQGFVIVSGETNTKPILAYSEVGKLSPGELPDNLKAWLQTYALEIASIRKASSGMETAASAETSVATTVVPPLLGNNVWTQVAPYNLFCPWDPLFQAHASVGCVALGMGQIMRYHQWPSKPRGMASYSMENIGLQGVDFDSVSYQWDNMPIARSLSNPTAADSAVASMLYHCGVTIGMHYSVTGSGADLANVGAAMVNYFDYDPDIQYYKREYFTQKAWEDLLIAELDEARPVLYGAFNGTSGHVFVCDGYDSQHLFHINWGWGGNGNGFFELSSLNPNYEGRTGVENGFSKEHSMLVRIQKPDGIRRVSYSMGMKTSNMVVKTTSFLRTVSIPLQFLVVNYGTNVMEGSLGLAILDSCQQLGIVDHTPTGKIRILSNQSKEYSCDLLLPPSFKNGIYNLRAVYKPADSTNWTIVPGINGVQVMVMGDDAKFFYPNLTSNVELNSTISFPHRLFEGSVLDVNTSILNFGPAFHAHVSLDLYTAVDSKYFKTLGEMEMDLKPYQIHEIEMQLPLSCPAGKYLVSMRSNSTNHSTDFTVLEPKEKNFAFIQVLPKPGPSNIQLTDTMILVRSIRTDGKDSLRLKASITNLGGFAPFRMTASIRSLVGDTRMGSLSTPTFFVDSLESKALWLTGSMSLPAGEYEIQLFQERDSTRQLLQPDRYSKTLFSIPVEPAVEYPPLIWQLHEKTLEITTTDEVELLNLYDLSGMLRKQSTHSQRMMVGDMPKGVYFLKIQLKGSVSVNRLYLP